MRNFFVTGSLYLQCTTFISGNLQDFLRISSGFHEDGHPTDGLAMINDTTSCTRAMIYEGRGDALRLWGICSMRNSTSYHAGTLLKIEAPGVQRPRLPHPTSTTARSPDRNCSSSSGPHTSQRCRLELLHHGGAQAIGDSGRAQRGIKTVHGRAFRFVASLQEHGHEPSHAEAVTTSQTPGRGAAPYTRPYAETPSPADTRSPELTRSVRQPDNRALCHVGRCDGPRRPAGI